MIFSWPKSILTLAQLVMSPRNICIDRSGWTSLYGPFEDNFHIEWFGHLGLDAKPSTVKTNMTTWILFHIKIVVKRCVTGNNMFLMGFFVCSFFGNYVIVDPIICHHNSLLLPTVIKWCIAGLRTSLIIPNAGLKTFKMKGMPIGRLKGFQKIL